MSTFTRNQARDGAAVLAMMISYDTNGYEALTDDLEPAELAQVLKLGLGCAAHLVRGTDAEDRLTQILLHLAR